MLTANGANSTDNLQRSCFGQNFTGNGEFPANCLTFSYKLTVVVAVVQPSVDRQLQLHSAATTSTLPGRAIRNLQIKITTIFAYILVTVYLVSSDFILKPGSIDRKYCCYLY